MITVPFLVLFFMSLAGYLIAGAASSKRSIQTVSRRVAMVASVLCGLYAVFMLWVWAGGWGDSSDATYVVLINGRPVYAGLASIFPILIFACILIPLMIFLPPILVTFIDKFIEDEEQGLPIWLHLVIILGASLIGFLSFFMIAIEWNTGETFWEFVEDYVVGDFDEFSIWGLILTICSFVIVRSLVNLVVSAQRKNNTSAPHP